MPPTLTTCTACGCTCDDIRLSVDGKGSVVGAAQACAIGEAWFGEPVADGPLAMVEGQQATLDEAIARAAEILSAARLPLVAGMQDATTEAIGAAVDLADTIGACVDWTASPADAAGTLALQTTGGVTATLGEVAQRADVVLVWGVDLAARHPRHFERYSLEPTSRWIAGRADRTLVVIDDRATDTAAEADESITIAQGADFESLAVLRSLVAALELDCQQVERQTGVALDVWQALVDRMKTAKFGAVVYGGSLADHAASLVTLTELMADLTSSTRWVSVAAGAAGNKTGAANVLAWQTGYPLAVSLAHRYPQYGPGEWTTAALLSRHEADAAVIVADDLATRLAARAAAHLKSIPTIALDWRATETWDTATVAIRTARPGVDCGGTTYRVDGVALPVRAAREADRPTAEAVLHRIKFQCSTLNVQV
jgi:formylmethanofuran dehydrogenase subunit B